MHHQFFDHEQGSFALIEADNLLTGIIWRGDKASVAMELAKIYPQSSERQTPLLCDCQAQIEAYLAGSLTHFTLPFSIEGATPFRKKILQALCSCPYATTISYAELAKQAGSPHAARAVGAAMAANPLPLVIPCHRVVGTGRKMTGYSGGRGIPSKEFLLELESRVMKQQG